MRPSVEDVTDRSGSQDGPPPPPATPPPAPGPVSRIITRVAHWLDGALAPVGRRLERTEELRLLRLRDRLDRASAWIALPPFVGSFGLYVAVFMSGPQVVVLPWSQSDQSVALLHTMYALMTFGGGLAYLVLFGLRRRVRDALAQRLAGEPNPAPPYVLFLRSFMIDETLVSSSVGSLPSARTQERLEVRLERASGTGTRLLKIGSRLAMDLAGGTHRPSRTDTQQWFRDVQRLAANADRIVMTPVLLRASSGTGLELREIGSSRLREKTVFIVPPGKCVSLDLRGRSRRLPMRWLWERSRHLCHDKFAISLPPYPGRSALIVPIDGQLTAVTGVAGYDWDHPKALAILLNGRRPRARLAHEVWRFVGMAVAATIVLPLVTTLLVALILQSEPAIGAALGLAPDRILPGVWLASALVFVCSGLRRQTALFVSDQRSRMTLLGAACAGVALGIVTLGVATPWIERTFGPVDNSPLHTFAVLSAFAVIVLGAQLLCSFAALAVLKRTSQILATQTVTEQRAFTEQRA